MLRWLYCPEITDCPCTNSEGFNVMRQHYGFYTWFVIDQIATRCSETILDILNINILLKALLISLFLKRGYMKIVQCTRFTPALVHSLCLSTATSHCSRHLRSHGPAPLSHELSSYTPLGTLVGALGIPCCIYYKECVWHTVYVITVQMSSHLHVCKETRHWWRVPSFSLLLIF